MRDTGRSLRDIGRVGLCVACLVAVVPALSACESSDEEAGAPATTKTIDRDARAAEERRERARERREARREEQAQAPPPAEPSCHPSYDPCLDPSASDYDCAGGSGDGPSYTGYVTVTGYDEYDLDSDGDGVGCES
ncbi:MAG: hypothetical protein WD993_00260 [Thermoleophilaceae bacterium]